MSDRNILSALGVAGLIVLPTPVVIAADYLSVESAQRAIFPEADNFAELAIPLTPAQQQNILTLAGPQPPHGHVRIWRAIHGDTLIGHLFVDEVIGRQDLITYALGIDSAGALRTLEILSYRESHGGEIRNSSWRKQFDHRSGLAQLNFRTDIKNIAGATLSSEHITQGVRWLVALWQTTLRTDHLRIGNP